MKRRIAIIICLLILVLLASCAKNNDDNNSAKNLKTQEKSDITNEIIEPSGNFEDKDAAINENMSSELKKDLLSLIPDGWRILERVEGKPEKAEGDLNKDGIDDIAVVIEEIRESGDVTPSRMLLIAFGNNDNTYTLSVKAENAILKSDAGGVWGDPLENISIDRGSILINFYGGSNWRWYSSYRFRFQDNDWYLIGATLGTYFTGNATIDEADEEDYNLLTGDFISKKRDESGNVITTKGNRGKRELIKLVDFVADSEKKQF